MRFIRNGKHDSPGMSSPALHRFALFTATVTFVLLGAGGLVTSHGVGMAVPDWPNTFGYNMFFFPFSQWVGGVFYEHSHRLLASGVGLLTTVLAIWLYGKRARRFLRWTGATLLALAAATGLVVPARWEDASVLGVSGLAALFASFSWPKCEPAKPWLRKLGLLAFLAVVLQGVLGGLRVVLYKDQLGIFHATLAQLFFVLMCVLALLTSRWWERTFASGGARLQPSPDHSSLSPSNRAEDQDSPESRPADVGVKSQPAKLAWLCAGATLLILAQLVLGATMRHQHAGLAIPDFPLAYGKWWPAMDPQSVLRYNQQRLEVLDVNPITSFQIALQMAHRLAAVLISGLIASCAWLCRCQFGRQHLSAKLALGWLGLILLQVLLGAATIWSNKAADVATAHVLVGALSMALGTMLSVILLSQIAWASRTGPVSIQLGTLQPAPLGSGPTPAIALE